MSRDCERRMHRVLDYIHDNPAGDLSLDALADVAAMSRFHWHRVFRGVTGETAAQAVRRLRRYRASVALPQGSDPLARLARSVGYANLASFNRTFSDVFGMSPSVFRTQGHLRPLPPDRQEKLQTMFPIEIRDFPTRRLAAMPHVGPYHQINRAFEKLSATMAARWLFDHAGRMVGVFYDDPQSVAPADLRSHAGFEMAAGVTLDAPLESVTLPAGRHAVLVHTGPYAGLPAAYDQLYSVWLPASGEEPADSPTFEIYRNSPIDTAHDALITELCLPLKSTLHHLFTNIPRGVRGV